MKKFAALLTLCLLTLAVALIIKAGPQETASPPTP